MLACFSFMLNNFTQKVETVMCDRVEKKRREAYSDVQDSNKNRKSNNLQNN